jgi:serine/threonine protein kinase
MIQAVHRPWARLILSRPAMNWQNCAAKICGSSGMTKPSAQENLVQRLVDEFVTRTRGGERVSPAEYAGRYPSVAEQLLRALPTAAERNAAADATNPDSDVQLAPDVKCPQRLGDFRILRQIGRGGMGVVYEAEQESLGRHVALKVLLSGPMMDAKQLTRFKREAQAAARLHHTNIVPVFGVGESDGLHYYVMQYIEGRGLEQVLADLRVQQSHDREPRLSGSQPVPRHAGPDEVTAVDVGGAPGRSGQTATRVQSPTERVGLNGGDAPDDLEKTASRKSRAGITLELHGPQGGRTYWRNVARIGLQVAEALAYAHAHGTLHRDIKPANLLLDTSGTVWVTDFGLAKASEQDNLTNTGDLVGTLRYMAPESFFGQVDARTDIYALGLTLFELIALRPAFDAVERTSLMHQVSSAQVPPLGQLRPDAPRDLETIVLKSLDRDPRHRYQTADELAADLERFINDEPILARRASPIERLRRWCRRNPAVAALTALLVLVFIAGFAGVTWKWREAEQQKTRLAAAKEELASERNAAIVARDQARQSRDAAELSQRRAEISDAASRDSARRAKALNHFLIEDVLLGASPERAHGTKLSIEDVVRTAGQHVDKTLAGQPDSEAEVHNVIGIALLRMGLYADAEMHLRKALALSRQSLGPDSNETIEAMNNLAQALKDRGKLAEAEPLMRQTLAARRRLLGPDNPEVLASESNLALVLQAQGKLAEAGKLAEQNLEHYRKVLGPDDPDTLLAQHNLALILDRQGRLSEAEPLFRETLAALIKNKKIGSEHFYALSTEQDLGRLLQTKGELEEAEKLDREVVTVRRRVSGPEHPDTLIATNQLATLLLDRGKLEEAEPLVRQLLASTDKVLGDDHPQSIVARQNMARMLQIEGKPQEAEPLLRKNVEACIKIYGPDYPDTLLALGNLAVDLQAQGKLDEAEPLVRDVVKSQTAVLGPDHPHTLVSMNNLVILLGAEGKLDEAEPLARKCLAACRRVLGPNHPDTLLAMSNIAQLMVARGRWLEAEPLLREGLETRRHQLGDSHPDTLNAMDDLVMVLSAESKLSEAEQLLEKTIAVRRRVLGPEHPDTLKSIRTLALVMDARGEFRQAEPLLRELIQQNSRKPGPNSTEALADITTLALNLEHQKQPAEAEALLRDVVARLRKQSPPPGAPLADALTVLADFLLRERRPDEAELPAREAVELGRKLFGEGHWQTALAENVLGAALLDLGRYSEAEPLLLSSLGILQLHTSARSGLGRQALERVVRLYQAWGKPKQADEWKQRLGGTEKERVKSEK